MSRKLAHFDDDGRGPVAYEDYGPVLATTGTWRGVVTSQRYAERPYCDLCGPFRGRYLRRAGRDEFGDVYRCRGCDNE